MTPSKGQVSVYGEGLKGPLLKTTEARLIQVRGADGSLTALFVRLTPDLWGFLTPADPDWEDTARRVEVKD